AEITPELAAWIDNQKMFFVATAPLAADSLINCSPKGLDTFRIIGPHQVIYLDLTGSGIETVAHLRENGRIVIMFCAFDGPAKIVRLHGRGTIHLPGEASYEQWKSLYQDMPGARGIVSIDVARISDSCGHSIPKYQYVEDRDLLTKWAVNK